MKSTVEILKEARELLSDEKRWCKEKLAMNQYGEACSTTDPRAQTFCAIGACRKIVGNHHGASLATAYLDRVAWEMIGESDIVELNDAPLATHADILLAFDRAIAIAEEEAHA